MISFSDLRAQWFGNIRGDLLAALIVVALVFPIITGVHPKIGSYGHQMELRQLPESTNEGRKPFKMILLQRGEANARLQRRLVWIG